jgi:hypothetical protein
MEEGSLTRHTRSLRIALISCAVSVGALLAAGSASSTLICPPGTTNKAYCTNIPPIAITTSASNVKKHGATLNGIAGPGINGGDITTYYFQYGKTTSYTNMTPPGTTGSCPPGATNPKYCTSDPAAQDVSAKITGLKPGTRYHYRLVASNPDGTTYGADQTFKTPKKHHKKHHHHHHHKKKHHKK